MAVIKNNYCTQNEFGGIKIKFGLIEEDIKVLQFLNRKKHIKKMRKRGRKK